MLSIVTINKNNQVGLQRTINSLASLQPRSYQWVFIDSCSTDDSLAIAKQFSTDGDAVVSEPDTGIYNAMNKGVRYATNPLILFLNSGDTISDNVNSLEALHLNPMVDVTLFGFIIRNIKRMPRNNLWRYWSMPTSHQAMIYSRNLLLQEPFDEQYRFAADFEHYLRINHRPLLIDIRREVLISNEPYGSDAHLPILLAEYKEALIKNGYPKWWASWVFWFKTHYLKWALKR